MRLPRARGSWTRCGHGSDDAGGALWDTAFSSQAGRFHVTIVHVTRGSITIPLAPIASERTPAAPNCISVRWMGTLMGSARAPWEGTLVRRRNGRRSERKSPRARVGPVAASGAVMPRPLVTLAALGVVATLGVIAALAPRRGELPDPLDPSPHRRLVDLQPGALLHLQLDEQSEE